MSDLLKYSTSPVLALMLPWLLLDSFSKTTEMKELCPCVQWFSLQRSLLRCSFVATDTPGVEAWPDIPTEIAVTPSHCNLDLP